MDKFALSEGIDGSHGRNFTETEGDEASKDEQIACYLSCQQTHCLLLITLANICKAEKLEFSVMTLLIASLTR